MSPGGSKRTPCILILEEGVRLFHLRGHKDPLHINPRGGGVRRFPGGGTGTPSILTQEEGGEEVPRREQMGLLSLY